MHATPAATRHCTNVYREMFNINRFLKLASLQYHCCTAETDAHTLSQNLCWTQKPDNNVRGRVQTWGLAPAVSWLELWDEASPWLSEGNQEYASRGNHTCLQEKTKFNVYKEPRYSTSCYSDLVIWIQNLFSPIYFIFKMSVSLF